jgi:hypothetical protein
MQHQNDIATPNTVAGCGNHNASHPAASSLFRPSPNALAYHAAMRPAIAGALAGYGAGLSDDCQQDLA